MFASHWPVSLCVCVGVSVKTAIWIQMFSLPNTMAIPYLYYQSYHTNGFIEKV